MFSQPLYSTHLFLLLLVASQLLSSIVLSCHQLFSRSPDSNTRSTTDIRSWMSSVTTNGHPVVPIATVPSPTSCKTRALLMIVGPTEYEEAVLQKLGEESLPQAAPLFIDEMGQALDDLCTVLHAPTGSPVIVAGSGSLGWDMIAASLLEAGDEVLLLNTGYFSDSFADCLSAYGMRVQQLSSAVGGVVELSAVHDALTANPAIKLVTFTQVDTSTAVLNDVRRLCQVIREVAPSALIAVDGVCSLGGEEFRFDEWGVDVAMSCSQKALGAPPGLTILMLSDRAATAVAARRSTIPSYYANLQRWLRVMSNYRQRKGGYYCTVPVNLIRAIGVSLARINRYGIDRRVADHRAHSLAVKQAFDALKLRQVPVSPDVACNTLTAAYYPPGVSASAFLSAAERKGVWLGGGLHVKIAPQYFRLGHMGISASPFPDSTHGKDVQLAIEALEYALKECGYVVEEGVGLAAYKASMAQYNTK